MFHVILLIDEIIRILGPDGLDPMFSKNDKTACNLQNISLEGHFAAGNDIIFKNLVFLVEAHFFQHHFC